MLQFWGEHKFKVLSTHTLYYLVYTQKNLQTSQCEETRYTDECVTTSGSYKTHTERGRRTHERYDVPKRIVSCQREYYMAEVTGAPEIDRSPQTRPYNIYVYIISITMPKGVSRSI